MKQLWWVPVILAIGFMWLREHDAQVKSQALAEARLEAMKVMQMSIRKSDSMLKEKDLQIQLQRDSIAKDREAAVRRQESAKRATAAVVDSLRLSLTKEQEAQLDRVVVGYEAQLSAQAEQHAATSRLLTLAYEQIDARDSLLLEYRQINQSLMDQLERETKRKMPRQGALAIAERYGPWIITAAAILTR